MPNVCRSVALDLNEPDAGHKERTMEWYLELVLFL